MKKKIVGILVVTLMIATAVLPVVGTMKEYNADEYAELLEVEELDKQDNIQIIDTEKISPKISSSFTPIYQDDPFQIPKSYHETVTLPAAKDSHVNPTYYVYGGHVWYEKDANNGDYPQLLIHETTHPSVGESCSWIYIQFDTSPIPQGARVLSATLRLFYLFANCWGVGTLDQSQPHEVYRVLGVWEENTITWRGRPQVSTVASASTNVNRMEGYYRNLNYEEAWIEWDVTSDVQQFVGGTSVNHGWCIRDTASFPGRQSYVYKYSSKESFLLYILSTEPQLVITYSTINNPPNTPTRPSGPTAGNVGQSLRYESTFSDPDGDSMNIMWDWGDGTPTEWYGVITSGLTVGAYHSWNSPGTYQVRTRARDIPFGAESDWSPALTVTIN